MKHDENNLIEWFEKEAIPPEDVVSITYRGKTLYEK